MSAPGNRHLIVDVPRQTLRLLEEEQILSTWKVSTSKFGIGTEEGSFRTPTGRFLIVEKIGGGLPPWSVFRSRIPTGKTATPGGDEDLILTRILWLGGLDPENGNTRGRHIYFHGTNREDLIGTPASHGCIRLANADMIELFDLVTEGTPVDILA